MYKKPFVFLLVSLLMVGGLLLTQGTTVASSRPLLGFTVTPEPTIAAPTIPPTAVPPAATAVPTPEEEEEEVKVTPVILPVTGEEAVSVANVCYSTMAKEPARFVNLASRGSDIPAEAQIPSGFTGGVIRIVIPSLSVDARVETAVLTDISWSVDDLGRKVGWLENTSLPGLGGNTVLAGHVSLLGGNLGPFYNLEHLQPGAKVYLYTNDNQLFVYQMRERRYVPADDISITEETSTSQLTMLTCSHWNRYLHEFQKRMAIVADLVSMKDLSKK